VHFFISGLSSSLYQATPGYQSNITRRGFPGLLDASPSKRSYNHPIDSLPSLLFNNSATALCGGIAKLVEVGAKQLAHTNTSMNQETLYSPVINPPVMAVKIYI